MTRLTPEREAQLKKLHGDNRYGVLELLFEIDALRIELKESLVQEQAAARAYDIIRTSLEKSQEREKIARNTLTILRECCAAAVCSDCVKAILIVSGVK